MNGQAFGPVVEPTVEPKKKEGNGIWKILTVVFGLLAAVLGFLYLTKKEVLTVVFVNEDNVRLEKIEKGSKVTKPENKDEDFIGWFDGGSEFDFSKGVEKDVVLYAKYDTSTEFTVTFDTDGGSAIEAVKVKENKTVAKPTQPTKSGYLFNEWMLNGEVYDFNTPVTSDITLKATWRVNDNTVMVRFDSAGGSAVNSQKVATGGVAKKPSNPTKACATFKEWQLDGSAYDFTKPVNSEITLKAVWTEKQKVTLTYDANGGTVSPTTKQVCPGEAVGALATPTKSGYVLNRWTLNNNTFNANSRVNGNTTIKAEWITQDEYNYNKAYAAIKASYDVTSNGQKITVSGVPAGCTVTHDNITTSSTTITFTITCGSKTGTKTAKANVKLKTYTYTITSTNGDLPYNTVKINGVSGGCLFYANADEPVDPNGIKNGIIQINKMDMPSSSTTFRYTTDSCEAANKNSTMYTVKKG